MSFGPYRLMFDSFSGPLLSCRAFWSSSKAKKFPSIRLYVDRPFVDKYTPSGFILTLFWPAENVTNGLTHKIRIFCGKKQKFSMIKLYTSYLLLEYKVFTFRTIHKFTSEFFPAVSGPAVYFCFTCKPYYKRTQVAKENNKWNIFF